MLNIQIGLLFTLLVHLCTGRADDIQFLDDDNHEFDLLIFTQQWPVTCCIDWMEKDARHSCTLPSPKEIWTIHGVWPTRFGSIGPAFCNKSAEFNIDDLKPFSSQLQQFWINIEKGTPPAGLWKHEWLKHGTCAAVLHELSNENKYFGQGLSWLQQYSMTSVLQTAGILPDQKLNLVDLHKGIVSVLKKNPSIHCVHDKQRDELYLDEIRICFTKSMQLTDCDGVVGKNDAISLMDSDGPIISNCDRNKVILYPSVVPTNRIQENTHNDWSLQFVNLYKLIDLIKWLTL